MKFRFRTVVQEFEAHFHTVQAGSKIHGKSEWKQYADGTYRFRLSVRDIPLLDGTEVDLWLEGRPMMKVTVQKAKARIDIENDSGVGVPAVKVGQVLQVKSGQTVLAEGKYQAE